MRIRFTKHAVEKFAVLREHGVFIPRSKVLHTVISPDLVDYQRKPLLIAQSNLDERHVLRVVYKIEKATCIIITLYPGRRSQYED